MKRKPLSAAPDKKISLPVLGHWPWFLTGPVMALVLIVFWILDGSFLSAAKSPVSALLENPLLTFGLVIFGSFISAFISGDMDVRAPLSFEPFVYAFTGGIGMGLGAVMASMSVHSVALFNLAGIFHLTAFMTVQGVVYVLFMILGGFIGARIFMRLMEKTAVTCPSITIPPELKSAGFRQGMFGWSLGLFGSFMVAVAFFSVLPTEERIKFLSAVLLLVIFGIVAERGTICMSSMLKEWFIAQSAYVWRGVLFTAMCLALFYQLALHLGWCARFIPSEFVPQLGLLSLGSLCMGAGFVFADGCFIGTLWKIGQGNLVNGAGFIGMLVGTGVGRAIFHAPVMPAMSRLPNDMELLLPRSAFLVLFWLTGLWLLLINRPQKTW